ncbi:MAG: UvrD-helicase domain-containing protein [Cytophagales bacterium]|nr:UvrD-helicase domain-containing protein [Cytophagales bacterium]
MHSTKRSTLSIYRSSAGSGKTYQLALEFISLAIRDPDLFNRILAVTFTNKATKEMKDRILDFLVKLSSGKGDELLSQVQERTRQSKKEIAENAGTVTRKILHQYTRFSVSTIDAFFQKIVKSFAKELGLLGNFGVELDRDKVKQEIIDRMIDEIGENKALTNWLIEFSYSKVDENKSWNIRPQIEMLTNEIFKESFRPIEKELSKLNHNDYKACLSQTKKIRNQFEHKMKSEAEKALKLMSAHGLSINDFAYKASGPAGYYTKILKNSFAPGERTRQACQNPENWYSRSSSKKDEIQKIVDSGLRTITSNLIQHYDRHIADYTTAKEVLKNIYAFGILSQITKKLKAYRQEHDVMLISDVSVFLNGIIAENDTPFIYEKTGSWYQNYLIDEFQDTSGFQWQNFKSLVENSLAEGKKNLLVGDGKQSIYRWRGGDWNLILNKVHEDLALYAPQEKFLNTNWRSAKNIVAFNNAIFGILPALIESNLKSRISGLTISESEKAHLSAKVDDVAKLYKDAGQRTAKKNNEPPKGRIEIVNYRKNDSTHWKEMALADLLPVIEQLQASGYQARDIAILVRKGEEGKKVIELLTTYKKSEKAKDGVCYEAISNESLYLQNSPAVRIIISAITFCLNPKDKIAFGEICFIHRHLQSHDAQVRKNEDLNYILSGASLPDNFTETCKNLIGLPVYEMIEKIIQLFRLGKRAHKVYLQAFQDVVMEYFAGAKKDMIDFLEWWHEQGKYHSIQIPEHVNAIQVMTIHKSKGLEFKAVLIPFCDWMMDHEATKTNYLWCKTDKDPYSAVGYLPLKYNNALANSYFAREYFEEMIKAQIDNLNLIYVALTRAEEFLMINCPPLGKEMRSAGDVVIKGVEIYEHTNDKSPEFNKADPDEHKIKYTIGNMAVSPPAEYVVQISPNTKSYRSSDWRTKIALKKRGSLFLSEKGKEKKAKIDFGLLAHEILASIDGQDEIARAIERYYFEGQISGKDKLSLAAQFNRIFSNAQVKSWFNTDWEVLSEASIVLKNQPPKRPDRVLVHNNKAIVIDFKTGMEKPADKKQILTYTEILKQMGYEKIEGYLLYITRNKVIQVA